MRLPRVLWPWPDVADGRSELGILICGSGIGVSVNNKVNGVRAALVVDAAHAQGHVNTTMPMCCAR